MLQNSRISALPILGLVVLACATFAFDRRLAAERQARWDGYHMIEFERLNGFDRGWDDPLHFDPAKPPTRDLPWRTRVLHGKRIAVEGYMTPIEWASETEQDRLRSFVLTMHPSVCNCAGNYRRLQDLVEVVMAGGRTASYIPLAPARVRGVLSVEEHVDEEGDVLAIYRIDATSVERVIDER